MDALPEGRREMTAWSRLLRSFLTSPALLVSMLSFNKFGDWSEVACFHIIF